ncbi:hypothetical protein GYMLUDRAFT_257966 [Collybiopsis luxurians FD-317 M1]|nr:hypothetical protein GYMLUDRAFT_257966 [Collybiopsis luxurians FD-317 M1]
MALKSRNAVLLSKSQSSKISLKQTTIDKLRVQKKDLEAKLDKLQEECTLYRKTRLFSLALSSSCLLIRQLAKESQAKAEEEMQKAVEEKKKAFQAKQEAQRITDKWKEEAKEQSRAAKASAATALEALEKAKQASKAQMAAEQLADEEKKKRENVEQAKASIEQELEKQLDEEMHARAAAELARDSGLKQAERAILALEEAEEAARKDREAQETGGIEVVDICAAQIPMEQEEESLIPFSRMKQAKFDAESDAASEREARENTEMAVRLALVISQRLTDQFEEFIQEKESLLATVQAIEHSLAGVQEDVLRVRRVQTQVSNSNEDNAEAKLRESQLRVEELTALVREWKEQAEDAKSKKEDSERTLERCRESQYHFQRQAEEYRKAKEEAGVEKRSAERYRQSIKVQAKDDGGAAAVAHLVKEEAEMNAKKAFAEAQEKWRKGVQLMSSASKDQIAALRRARQFREGAFHVGVVGLTGTGKSSLINALMGIVNGTPGAVPTGNQSTKTIGRYSDAKRKYPYIWYDIPGAGTSTAPGWNYFNDQGLHVFDALIVAWDNCLSDVDIAVLDNSAQMKIPSFIVRTKSDIHISNIEDRMRDVVKANPTLRNKDQKNAYSAIPSSAREEYILETRQSVEDCLRNTHLPSMKVYPVSNKTILKIVQEDKNIRNVRVIDEFGLLKDIWALMEATVRHGGGKERSQHQISRPPQMEGRAERWVDGRWVTVEGKEDGARNPWNSPSSSPSRSFEPALPVGTPWAPRLGVSESLPTPWIPRLSPIPSMEGRESGTWSPASPSTRSFTPPEWAVGPSWSERQRRESRRTFESYYTAGSKPEQAL